MTYNLPHVSNINFPEYKFVLLFLHTTENNFGERKEHEMKEWSILNVYTSLIFYKKKVFSPEWHYRTFSAFCTGIFSDDF